MSEQLGCGREGEEGGEGGIRRVLREHIEEELKYKEGELHKIEERIDLTKMLLQRLRLGILAQHYGVSAFTPALDFSEESVGEQGTWEEFEHSFLMGDCVATATGNSLSDPNQDSSGASSMAGENQSAVSSQSCSRESSVSGGECVRVKEEVEEEELRVTDGEMEKVCEVPRAKDSSIPSTSVPEAAADRSTDVSRFYSKKRVIVGNTSQYIDPTVRSGGDDSTHKWMVYVRGSTEEADISHFVKSVRFFLHPSYHPNDIVLVSKPPFHLTRLGWGEFPIRVQLEFMDHRNKPVDIIHNLVLDRTHTGLQTLGAETVVNLDIAIDRVYGLPCPRGLLNGMQTAMPQVAQTLPGEGVSDLNTLNKETASRQVEIPCKEEPSETLKPSLPPSPTTSPEVPMVMEHSNKQPLIIQHLSLPPSSASDIILLDHDYCANVVVSHLSLVSADKHREEEEEEGEVKKEKIDGDVPPVLKDKTDTNSVGSSYSLSSDAVAPQLDTKPLVLTTNLDRVLHRAVQSTPLWGPPSEGFFLSAGSLAQFKNWNIGRRRAAEWMRAVAVRRYIQRKLNIPLLSIRGVVEWCRRNGYTPLDPAHPGGPGFCKYCGCQLGVVEGGGGEEEEEEEEGDSHESCKELYEGREDEAEEEEEEEAEEEEAEEEESATGSNGKDKSTRQPRTQFMTLSTPFELFENVVSLQRGLEGEVDEKREVEEVDVVTVSPQPSRQRELSGIPRYRVPQTLELKWVQQTSARIGIRIYPAVIDRMYAHVVEHMLFMACSRFLKAVLTQAVQEAGRRGIAGERGGESSQERVLVPLHVFQALQNLEFCDFLTNRYMGRPLEDGSSDSEPEDH